MSREADRARGVLVGLAAGDRIGGPIRMALRLTESLVERRSFDASDILSRYLAWWCAGGFDTGPVAEDVFALIVSGVPADDAVRRTHALAHGMTAGCNPAHRTPPLAMAAFLADEELADLARRESRLTHQHPIAGEVAAEVVVLCRRLIRGEAWADLVPDGSIGDGVTDLSRGGFAPDVLRAALYFVTAHDNVTDALTAAVTFAGAANYCPVLTGALAGARWGASAIPASLLVDRAVREETWRLANTLAAGWPD